nr:immunoglobulin light chain junction region [Macaca mulatta]
DYYCCSYGTSSPWVF